MERDNLLKKLTILDFVLTDLALYLDTHPDDCEAIHKYNTTAEHAHKVRCEYEQMVGPVCSYRSKSKDSWTWIDKPWPWSESFNFTLAGEERYHVGI